MVRHASPADALGIAAMLHEFNLEYGETTLGEAFLASRIEQLITEGAKHFLLAETDVAIGFAQIDFRPTVYSRQPVATMEELYVKPGSRGEGHGRMLMEAMLGMARERGCPWVEIVTGEDDTAARGLYASFGFRNEIEGYDNERALYYELELETELPVRAEAKGDAGL